VRGLLRQVSVNDGCVHVLFFQLVYMLVVVLKIYSLVRFQFADGSFASTP
jgi:hypothetical protein